MVKLVVTMALLAPLLPGCAQNAEWMQRQPGVESTIGTDMNQAPAGRVIPPPGLGVDLSHRTGDTAPRPLAVVSITNSQQNDWMA